MKKAVVLLAACCTVLCACVKKDTDALFTDATLTAVLPDTLQMVRFQATAVFTNTNTKRTASSSDFRDGVLGIRLQKGFYAINIYAGTVEYIVKSTGRTQMRQVTVDERVPLLGDTETVSVNLLWDGNKPDTGE